MSQKDMIMIMDKIAAVEEMFNNNMARLQTAERRIAAMEKKVYDGKRPTNYEINVKEQEKE